MVMRCLLRRKPRNKESMAVLKPVIYQIEISLTEPVKVGKQDVFNHITGVIRFYGGATLMFDINAAN